MQVVRASIPTRVVYLVCLCMKNDGKGDMTTEIQVHQALSLILHISRQGSALEGGSKKREKFERNLQGPTRFHEVGHVDYRVRLSLPPMAR